MTKANENILIAEDSPTQAQQLRFILERQGFVVTSATNGALALEEARMHPPTLIISDVVMPEMDGYELCRQVKSDPDLKDIPLILVTSLSDPGEVIRGLECRADNFLLKPYEEGALLERVQYVIDNRNAAQRGDGGMGVEIQFDGNKHFITANRLQILNLLLSTYEAAIQRNRGLQNAQDQLQALNDQILAANNELEAFSYSVSHDLRAPLRHIHGYVEMLTRSVGDQASSKAQHYMRTIADASVQMGQLIDDLLAFSRMGRTEIKQGPLKLDALIQEVISSMELDVRGRKIEWSIASFPTVIGDASMLRQVLANLLGNAVKYSRPREMAQIEIGCDGEEDGRIIVFVRDNGVGFDMNYAHKLFGVFQRLHRADEFEGTGIGLATVQRVIARHGGWVWAESTLGEGATFYFTLKPITTA